MNICRLAAASNGNESLNANIEIDWNATNEHQSANFTSIDTPSICYSLIRWQILFLNLFDVDTQYVTIIAIEQSSSFPFRSAVLLIGVDDGRRTQRPVHLVTLGYWRRRNIHRSRRRTKNNMPSRRGEIWMIFINEMKLAFICILHGWWKSICLLLTLMSR